MTLEEIKNMLIALIEQPGHVTIRDNNYRLFHSGITEYIHVNFLENSNEWKIISNNLIYSSSSYFSLKEANNILIEIDKLKRTEFINNRVSDLDKRFLNTLHPEIKKVSENLFLNKNYSESIECAFKEINSRLKKLYKKYKFVEKDGTDLMHAVFNYKDVNIRLLTFENLDTESGKNVQEGYMHIFAGAMQAIRNPKAHENLISNKENAIDRLILANLLMKKIDEAIIFTGIQE